MLPTEARDRRSIPWSRSDDPHHSFTRLYPKDARSSNPRYVSEDPNGFARRSDQGWLEEDSPDATRYSNFRYVDREARSSNFAGRGHIAAGFEEAVEDEASGDDVDLEDSMSTNQVTIPELEDMENLVISPVRQGKPKDADPRCEICQEPIELPDASSSLAKVFDQSETSTASSSRRFTCGHRLHSICYENLGEAWDAATALCPLCRQPFLASDVRDLVQDMRILPHRSAMSFATDLPEVDRWPEPHLHRPSSVIDESVRTGGDGLRENLGASFAAIRDPSEQQHDDDDSKSFAEIHRALSDTCRATSRACGSLLDLLTGSEEDPGFASLYLALLTRDLLAATTTLKDMLGVSVGRQLQGANTIFFFTVCKKYLQSFLALVDEVRAQGANAEYIVILRPVQRLSRRAAQLIASSRWSTAGDRKLPTPG